MCDLGEKFVIKVMTTAAQKPWSNSVCECMSSILARRVNKSMDESKRDLSVALAWAVSARNSLSNHNVFAPNQLVFVYNPAIPNVFEAQVPALEDTSVSKMVMTNLSAMHEAYEPYFLLVQ